MDYGVICPRNWLLLIELFRSQAESGLALSPGPAQRCTLSHLLFLGNVASRVHVSVARELFRLALTGMA
jgi:hypothetical protein